MHFKSCNEYKIYHIVNTTNFYIEINSKGNYKLGNLDSILFKNSILTFEQRYSYPSPDQIENQIFQINSQMEVFCEFDNLFDIFLQSSIYLLIINDYIDPKNKYLQSMQSLSILNPKPIDFIYQEFYDFVYSVVLEFAIFYFVKNIKMTEKAFIIFCKSLKLEIIITKKKQVIYIDFFVMLIIG